MNRKIVLAGILLLGLLCAASGCKKAEKRQIPERLRIVCSFLPVYVMTQNVAEGVPGVVVQNLLPANVGCPHNYSLTPTDVAALEKADVLVITGLGMEEFLLESPTVNRPDLQVIDACSGIEPIIEHFAGTELKEGHTNDKHLVNPHAWVSPIVAAQMVRTIGASLAEIDTVYRDKYQRNTESYAARLDTIGAGFIRILSAVENRRIVTFHKAFEYLARDANLEIVAVMESDAGVEPSARELAKLVEVIKEAEPVGIFTEPQYANELAKTLSQETGIPVYMLDPAVTGDGDPMSYIRVMMDNLRTLKRALNVNLPDK